MNRGLVLFAHGARDARWREPFDRLQQKLAALLPGDVVRLAFLELMAPDLSGALAELAAQGVTAVTVVPVFFGQGGHLRSDLPVLLDDCRTRFPDLTIHCAGAVGESDAILNAIAAYCVTALD